jgi:hypothetical protein
VSLLERAIGAVDPELLERSASGRDVWLYFYEDFLAAYDSRLRKQRGVVTLITPSSYLRGPGFAGMRRFMRETLDELWMIDLGGEGRGARRSENVFDIQTPVAIAIGVCDGSGASATAARIRYARLDGSREEKLSALDAISSLDDLHWRECYPGWPQPFLPVGEGDYFSWPPLTDLFPWQHSGVQFKRTWPIGPDRETLERRWVSSRCSFNRRTARTLPGNARSKDWPLVPVCDAW